MKQQELAKNIGNLIERLSRLMRAYEHDTDLNPVQWEAMRYLSKCNRFSNSPKALSGYLMSTKGSVSQTLAALERKGLVVKRQRAGERRSIEVALTEAGWRLLENDPWLSIERQIAGLPASTLEGLHQELASVLYTLLQENRFNSFGICGTCRHFRKNDNVQDRNFPHRCALLDVALSDEDSQHICAEHKEPETV